VLLAWGNRAPSLVGGAPAPRPCGSQQLRAGASALWPKRWRERSSPTNGHRCRSNGDHPRHTATCQPVSLTQRTLRGKFAEPGVRQNPSREETTSVGRSTETGAEEAPRERVGEIVGHSTRLGPRRPYETLGARAYPRHRPTAPASTSLSRSKLSVHPPSCRARRSCVAKSP
jgi:hypothetical protein